MRLLYPSDPINTKVVDETYGAEYEAARSAGFETSLFSFESFERGDFRARPGFAAGEEVMYRGWMLSVSGYEQLVARLEAGGAKALTSVEQYRRCHHLPEWHSTLSQFTAETLVLREDVDFEEALAGRDWGGYFVKDYVKSLSTAGGSLADTPQDIPRIVALMKKYRGLVEGGVCVRRREDYETASERRYFVFKGAAFAPTGVVPELVTTCAKRIDSPFFSVDVALRSDGELRLVELGDGQVSDRKEWSPEEFAHMLATSR
jgi:hypothetical protein